LVVSSGEFVKIALQKRINGLYSPPEIAALEEQRQARGTAEIARESQEIAGGWMSYAGEGSWANQACGLGLQGAVTARDLDRLVEFYTRRNVEPRIEVCPFVDETLIADLSQRGFQLREFENVLARELPPNENLRIRHPYGWPDNLELQHIDATDSTQIRTFADASTLGFRAEGEPLSEVDAEATVKMVRHSRCDAFLARVGDLNVGGGAMESSDKIACLFSTSIGSDHRRKGIQTALMIRRLERATERGCSLAVIHSTPDTTTERNARRLGFTLAYTKVVLAMPGPGLKPSP
jgi:GNAT superfamily N-acetyltransferase